jgi:hypothetical protein
MISLAVAVLTAAIAAFLGNRGLFRMQDRWAVVTLVPWWEEVCKGLAVWALPGRPLLAIHLLFGLLEFGYSAWRGERFLGLVGLTVHGFVGAVSAWLLSGSGFPGPFTLTGVVLTAVILHMLINLAVLGAVFPTLGLPGLVSRVEVDPKPGGRYNEPE